MKLHSPISPRAFSALTLVLLVAVTGFAEDTNQPTASPPDYRVKLRYEKEITLTEPAVQMLYSNAVKLLKSSSFNSSRSSKPQMHRDISQIEEDYRVAVSGRYLLVSFKEPQHIKTYGGEVSVREIVISLDRYGLFTKDDEGRVITHEKSSGQIFMNLLQAVKKIVNDASPAQRQ